MATENNPLATLPLNTFDDIPQPRTDAKEIVALVKEKGRVTGYQLSDGSLVTKAQGVAMAREGGIKGVGIASRKRKEYLRSLPDEKEQNNLSSLPSVTQ